MRIHADPDPQPWYIALPCTGVLSHSFAHCRHDKFAPAREVFELFNQALAHHHQCGFYLVQDETLYPYRSQRLPFRVYMKSKLSQAV